MNGSVCKPWGCDRQGQPLLGYFHVKVSCLEIVRMAVRAGCAPNRAHFNILLGFLRYFHRLAALFVELAVRLKDESDNGKGRSKPVRSTSEA